MAWRPESFTDFAHRIVSDPTGASNALDLSMQTIAQKTSTNENQITALQPIGGITRNRPVNPPLFTPFWDSTINKQIIFQGRGVWKDTMGNVV